MCCQRESVARWQHMLMFAYHVPFLCDGVIMLLCYASMRRRTLMPVLESMPRSALRHRPIDSDVDQSGKTSIVPVARRATRLTSPQTEEEGQISPSRSSTDPRVKAPRPIQSGVRRRGTLRAHPLLLLGLGM